MKDNLSFWQKILYGLGGLPMNLTNLVISQWLYILYVPSAKKYLVSPLLFGIIIFLGRISDAIFDVLIGYASDNLLSKRGRRIPFIRHGVIPLTIVYFLMWVPPFTSLHWFNALYIFIFTQLYFLFYTIVIGPYIALIPQLSASDPERITITTVQGYFVLVGTIIFGLSGFIIEKFGWAALGASVALSILICFFYLSFCVKEKNLLKNNSSTITEEQRIKIFKSFVMTTKNKPFIFYAISQSLYWFGLNLLLLWLPYWTDHFLKLSKESVTTLMMPFLIANAVFFILFRYISIKFGKYFTFLLVFFLSAIITIGFTFVGTIQYQHSFAQTLFLITCLGIPVSGFIILPYTLLAEVTDFDEKNISGQRREAIYVAVQGILQKVAIAISVLIFSIVAFYGDKITTPNLRFVVVVAAASFILGFIFFFPYKKALQSSSQARN